MNPKAVRLLETVADIGYLAGVARWTSGDSRADIQTFIGWGQEFEALRTVRDGEERYLGTDYLTAIDGFCRGKLSLARGDGPGARPGPGIGIRTPSGRQRLRSPARPARGRVPERLRNRGRIPSWAGRG